MPNSIITMISILSAFSLFVPVFSGYLLALIMAMIAAIVKFIEISSAEINLRKRFYSRLRKVSWGILFFCGMCGTAALAVYFTEVTDGSKLARAFGDFLVKNCILWFIYLSFFWRLAANSDYRMIFSKAFAGLAVVNLIYCLIQRSYGVDWSHGFSAVLPPNRMSLGVFRVSGFMGHPLSLGYCQALATIAACGLAMTSHRKREKFAWWISSASCLCVVLISGSRGPQMALFLSLLVILPIAEIKKHWRLVLVSVLVSAFIAIKFNLFARFSELSTSKFGGDMRITHWRVYWQIFTDHLLFGLGSGGQEAAISAYYSAAGSDDNIKSAHNALLQLAADYGVFGLLGWSVLFRSWLNLAATSKLIGRAFFSAVFLTVIGALTQNNLQDSEYVLAFTVWLMLLTTIEVEYCESTKERGTETKNLFAGEDFKTT
jgi:hypothetical protein